MPRHKNPLAIARLVGALRRNPGRYKEEAHSGPLGDVPPHLDEGQRAAWRDLSKASPDGLLQRSDRMLVEIASCLLAEHRAAPQAAGAGRIGVYLQCIARLFPNRT